MENQEIREKIVNNGLKFWKVAEKLGINCSTFSVWLRYPLSYEKKSKIENAINELLKGKERKNGSDDSL